MIVHVKTVNEILRDYWYVKLPRRWWSHLKYIRQCLLDLILKEYDEGKLTDEEKKEKEDECSVTIVFTKKEYTPGTGKAIIKALADDTWQEVDELKKKYNIRC